jgi:hypothetical protein
MRESNAGCKIMRSTYFTANYGEKKKGKSERNAYFN